MVEIKNVVVNYSNKQQKIQALGPITMTIEDGEIIVLIGPSGCGKSTLLNVLGGNILGYEGTAELDNAPINYKEQAIGYIPQGYGLLPWKNVYENCMLPYTIKGIKVSNTIKKQIDEVLEALGIDGLKKRYAVALSGGQKQRVALARAFAFKPKLLLMDEPFSALDAIMKEEAIEVFLKLWNKHKCTSVIVTHSIEEALYIGTKIVILTNTPGKISKIMDNPLFGKKDFRSHKDFQKYYEEIKGCIKEGWEG